MVLFDQLGIDAGYVIIGIIGVVMIICILLIVLMIKHRNLKRKYNEFMLGQDGQSLEKVIMDRFKQVDDNNEHMVKIDKKIEGIEKFLQSTYNKAAVIKYNAFQEMGGNLSFALAMLTNTNDGFILNVVHSSREGCYNYIKIIKNGKSETELSDEEKQVLDQSMGM